MSNSITDNVDIKEEMGFRMEVRDVPNPEDCDVEEYWNNNNNVQTEPYKEIPYTTTVSTMIVDDDGFLIGRTDDNVEEDVSQLSIEDGNFKPVDLTGFIEQPSTSSNETIETKEEPKEVKKKRTTKSTKSTTTTSTTSSTYNSDLLIQEDPNEEFIPNCLTNSQFERFMLGLNTLKNTTNEVSIKNGVVRLESTSIRAIVHCDLHLPNVSFDLPDITSNMKMLSLFKTSDVIHFEEDNSVYVFYSGKNSIQIRKAVIDERKFSSSTNDVVNLTTKMLKAEDPFISLATYDLNDEAERKEAFTFATLAGGSSIGIISSDDDSEIMFRSGDMNRGQLTFLNKELANVDIIKESILDKKGIVCKPLVDTQLDTTFMKWNYTNLKIGIVYNRTLRTNDSALFVPIVGRISDCIDMLLISKIFLNLSE